MNMVGNFNQLFANFPIDVGRVAIASAPEGVEAEAISFLARSHGLLLHVTCDDTVSNELKRAVAFFDPELQVMQLPPWDCLPYDRFSPNKEIMGQRIETLSMLALRKLSAKPALVITTVNAVLQRVPPKSFFIDSTMALKVGQIISLAKITDFFVSNGYYRSDMVQECGEYAVHGGTIDVFPTGTAWPVRLDFFGDTLEEIRCFDPISQRTINNRKDILFLPAREVQLNAVTIQRFRSSYRSLFGAEVIDDPVYESISAGRFYSGMEHWLPLFYQTISTVLDYVGDAPITLGYQVEKSINNRFEQITEYHNTRMQMLHCSDTEADNRYRPLDPCAMYLMPDEWDLLMSTRVVGIFTPFAIPSSADSVIDLGARSGISLAEARALGGSAVYDAVRHAVMDENSQGRRVVIAAYSKSSCELIARLFHDHSIDNVDLVANLQAVLALPIATVATVVLPLKHGYRRGKLTIVSECEIFGQRLLRQSKLGKRRGKHLLREISALTEGDYVVHYEHGIGRYLGLETLEINDALHDVLCLEYLGGDKLFVLVENIDVLSRYGDHEFKVQLDKLGGLSWRSRKAKVKKRLFDMAEKLINIAANRELRKTQPLCLPVANYDKFCSRFPFIETEDQLKAIDDVLADMESSRPMDRLICGDVGFGKTEVALRAAFVATGQGYQVAVVVPTTLLCRQHYVSFVNRFEGFPIKVAQISRLISTKEANDVRDGLRNGNINIVVGTHALLSNHNHFDNLGLVIIDEEQHFGVSQKELLKDMRNAVHVLTMTATPIPRTTQMALSGLREMSLITTPPVDRLAVQTFVIPYDGMVVRDALLRERHRGGQTFYVCPRIDDLVHVHEQLLKLILDLRIGVAHGRMASNDLEDVITSFIDGNYDVLISTNILESGLDIPAANTIIIHRSDMFGLAQLYQLRGRVGRSKAQAYAYLTTHPTKLLPPAAKRRLEVLQTFNNLGACLSLASHDIEIRGAGNLLGDQQSGQVKEVGIELYHEMLREAVEVARAGDHIKTKNDTSWTPQITINMPVLIPPTYISNISMRMSLYRRIAMLINQEEIDGFIVELVDRFGPLPVEVDNLLKIMTIKLLCRVAGVEKIDAGSKGAIIAFRNNSFAYPDKLITFMQQQADFVQFRPDHRMIYRCTWNDSDKLLRGLIGLMKKLAAVVV
ncbi:transcription-repair coupling factor [Candidatus Endolissoclinum faulkneri L2]|uniref:Transcription-repair-coupling factor n=1 Tax=Candidatus Endolissoclinum faulkneri L2 TaxID=1193729 RepID=K7YPT2_9PROT|nr:transcription-repair coupling factor [Candidatus Endolissoclinum faulkneri]AFX99542.1 transcription-repair coupling factor [Candidatus Endolissoclinum faulkneri L2]